MLIVNFQILMIFLICFQRFSIRFFSKINVIWFQKFTTLVMTSHKIFGHNCLISTNCGIDIFMNICGFTFNFFDGSFICHLMRYVIIIISLINLSFYRTCKFFTSYLLNPCKLVARLRHKSTMIKQSLSH